MALRFVREGALLAVLCAACGGSSTTPETGGTGPGGGAGELTSGGRAGASGSGGRSSAGTAGGGAESGSAGVSSDTGGTSGEGGTENGGAGDANGGTSGSGISGTSAASGSGGIPIDTGPVEIARVFCDRVFGCCSDEELATLPQNLGDSEGTCQLSVAIYLTLIVQGSQGSLDAGRIQYDGVALADCLQRYGTEGCELLRSLDLSTCPDVFAPQVELGDACGVNGDCIDGYCDGSNDAANPVGHCSAKKQLGAACAVNEECESGLCAALGAGCVTPSQGALCGG